MKRKVIGIPGWKTGDNSFGCGVNHLEFINRYGEPRILMPWEEVVDVDMVYLPGGADTAPVNYGATPGFKTGNADIFKDHFLNTKLGGYVANGTPIFGVCLGAQQIAVNFGGKLTQHLIWHAQSKDRWATAHEIHALPTAKELFGKGITKMDVNSHHHQALCMKNLSPDIIPLMVAGNEDNYLSGEGDIVEAFVIKDRPIFGVQWHPEELYDTFTERIITNLLKD